MGLGMAGAHARTPGYGTDGYGYPIEDPVAATVVGTPEHLKYPLEDGRPRFRLLKTRIRPKAEIPAYFWYHDRFKTLLFPQREPSPLVFVLAGTGGNYSGRRMLSLMKAFYDEGFHVLGLPNPTYMNFIINASSSGVPGLPEVDAEDLYNALVRIWTEQLEPRIEVTEFHFTGYSLGGTLAAWMAHRDAEARFFDFRRVLLINPSVSLFNSVEILDGYFENNLQGPDQKGFKDFWNRTMSALSRTAREDGISLGEDFLYDAFLQQNPDERSVELLIGTAFRISAQSLMVTADVMSRSSFIIPTTLRAARNANVDDYFIVSARTSFMNYFDGLLLPHYQERMPGLTRDQAIYQAGLAPLTEFLRQAEHVAVVHNADDIILADGEIDWLTSVFGDRAKIWPRGGHMGNLEYRENVEWMLEFFTD
jgi:pimeloyl-ACP methyl ester carboxylesterase